MFLTMKTTNHMVCFLTTLASVLGLLSSSNAIDFRPLQYSNGTSVCAGDEPSSSDTLDRLHMANPSSTFGAAPEVVQCAYYCSSPTKLGVSGIGCVGFNYLAISRQCDFYLSPPQKRTSRPYCMYYQDTFITNNELLTCKQRLARDPTSTSGEYAMTTITGRRLNKVYCDMTTNGGGYTFINPVDLAVMTEKELLAMYTDNQTVVLQMNMVDNSQRNGIAEQLPDYSRYALKLGLNEVVGYESSMNDVPKNRNFLGSNFLFLGFIPASVARVMGITLGLQVNKQLITFTNCDGNTNSYIALFPNIDDKTPSGSQEGAGTYGRIIASLNPSSVSLPANYFMFLETTWGGCGGYAQTNFIYGNERVTGAAIGFR